MKVDILFLAKNRREYTEEALRQLEKNTNWDLVSQLIIYNDGSEDSRPKEPLYTRSPLYMDTDLGGPVAVMNHFIGAPALFTRAPWFAKIDNDTIVPPGWLDACTAIAETDNVDLIGIEARYCEHRPMDVTRPPMLCTQQLIVNYPTVPYPMIKYRRTDHVGGIGLFRRSVFETHPLPTPNGTYYGFTEWQWANPDVRKCWIDPPLPVFLLDHLNFDPWKSLGEEYVSRGWQRESWGYYGERDKKLWEWWDGGVKK